MPPQPRSTAAETLPKQPSRHAKQLETLRVRDAQERRERMRPGLRPLLRDTRPTRRAGRRARLSWANRRAAVARLSGGRGRGASTVARRAGVLRAAADTARLQRGAGLAEDA